MTVKISAARENEILFQSRILEHFVLQTIGREARNGNNAFTGIFHSIFLQFHYLNVQICISLLFVYLDGLAWSQCVGLC